jgi:hypothetical protein
MRDWTRSSRCNDSNICVEVRHHWNKASTCDSGTCVEVYTDGDEVQVRDSRDPGGAILTFTVDEWEAFTEGVKAGEFDL